MTKSGPGKVFRAPERTVERGRGCWNCKFFENEDLSRQHYQETVQEEKAAMALANIPAVTRLGADDGSIQEVARKAADFIRQGHNMEDATNMALAAVGGKNPSVRRAVEEARRADARFTLFNIASSRGEIGICMKGGSESDFVHHAYLCGKWTGREGHSLATEGHATDKLPEELVDDLESKAEKV